MGVVSVSNERSAALKNLADALDQPGTQLPDGLVTVVSELRARSDGRVLRDSDLLEITNQILADKGLARLHSSAKRAKEALEAGNDLGTYMNLTDLKEDLDKVRDLATQLHDAKGKHALSKRWADLVLSLVDTSDSFERTEFVKKRNEIDLFSGMSPSDMIRKLAFRGKEAVEALGPPEATLVTFVERVARAKFLPEEWNKLDIAAAHNMHMAARWALYGFNQFKILPDLAAGLILTEMTETELQLPFETFVLSLQPGAIPFIVDEQKTMKWADTLWVHAFEAQVGETTGRFLRIFLVHQGMALIETVTRSRLPQETGAAEDATVFAREDRVSLDGAWRLLRNFLSWLDATGGLTKQNRETVPRKLAEKRAKGGEVWPSQWEMGREVKIATEIRHAAAEVVLGKSKRHSVDGWKVRSRFIVRGHFRNQACGTGRKDRVRKWIEPFWKGPEGAKAWSHLYTDK